MLAPSVKTPPAQNESHQLGVLIIDHIEENIPNVSWEVINNVSAPVSGLFFLDTAYTLQRRISIGPALQYPPSLERHEQLTEQRYANQENLVHDHSSETSSV